MKNKLQKVLIQEKNNKFSSFKNKYTKHCPEIADLSNDKKSFYGIMFYELAYAHESMMINYKTAEQQDLKDTYLFYTLLVNNKDKIRQCDLNIENLHDEQKYNDLSRKLYTATNIASDEVVDCTVEVGRELNEMFYLTNKKLASQIITHRDPVLNATEMLEYLPMEDYNNFLSSVESKFQSSLVPQIEQ